MEEMWLPVVGYEGRYLVSNTGLVRSITTRPRLLKPRLRKGYLSVSLRDGSNEAARDLTIHRMVAEAFHGPSDGQVRHLDGNRLNNASSNLAWGTALENAADRERHGRTAKGERHYKCGLTEEVVLRIRAMARSGYRNAEIGKGLGLATGAVFNIVKRRSWKHLP